MTGSSNKLNDFLDQISFHVRSFLDHSLFLDRLPEGLIKERIMDYSARGGKCLRPALVSAAAGAVGGSPDKALPVAVAVEIFHTWTLVHDDIIDRDTYRRGGLTIHARIQEDLERNDSFQYKIPIDHLAHSVAMLIGDAQHGLVIDIFAHTPQLTGLPHDLVLDLLAELEGRVLPDLLTGEVSDVLQATMPLPLISIEEIELMLHRKTGALLTYSVVAGGAIGIGKLDIEHPSIQALKSYGRNLGLAFQMRDDVLGIVGDQKTLGKPVGSDFREGKRTLAVKYAFERADDLSRRYLEDHLGKVELTDCEIETMKGIVRRFGGLDYINQKSETLIAEAIDSILVLEDSEYRQILIDVANFTINRQI